MSEGGSDGVWTFFRVDDASLAKGAVLSELASLTRVLAGHPASSCATCSPKVESGLAQGACRRAALTDQGVSRRDGEV
jgi:hypothetical protein